MARHVVVGKGPVGSATAQLLAEGGHEVLVLSRSGGESTAQVRHAAVDAADAAALAAAVGRDQPFVLDSTGTTEVLGLQPTPWDEVVRATAGAATAGV
jgi:nucleoside-diphosphate-sugar epimerase